MARKDSLDAADKVRLLRTLAFEIRRKQPPDEVLRQHLDDQMRLGRHREYRPAGEALAEHGFAAALRTLGLIGDDAAIFLAALVETKDHRLLAGALSSLADHLEGQGH